MAVSDCDTQERVMPAQLDAVPPRGGYRLWVMVGRGLLDPFPVALVILAATLLLHLGLGAGAGTILAGGVG